MGSSVDPESVSIWLQNGTESGFFFSLLLLIYSALNLSIHRQYKTRVVKNTRQNKSGSPLFNHFLGPSDPEMNQPEPEMGQSHESEPVLNI